MSDEHISILVVDDEPAIREVFKHFLARRGHEVVTCGSAEEALKTTESREFDVVILDIVLPAMSGLEMAEALQKRNSRSNVIVLTGASGQDDVVKARQLKVFRYLSKPIRATTLIDVVEEAGSLPPPAPTALN